MKKNLNNILQDDPEVPFTEEDFRRRKPHPNFKEHLNAEKTVLKFGKTVSEIPISMKKRPFN
jgi:hypothetical protein